MIPEKGKCYYIQYESEDDFGYIGGAVYTGDGKISPDGTILYLFEKLIPKMGSTTSGYFSSSDIVREISDDYSI